MVDRLQGFSSLSNRLAGLSDSEISALLDEASSLRTGIGGKSVLLSLEGRSVFVKQVPLTDLERLPQNLESTANLFGLPPFFHYRVGSPGLGVWREVDVHRMTTEWVISGQCPSFPLMYHWRILPQAVRNDETPEDREGLERAVRWWEGSTEVRARFEAIDQASAYVVLFLEYIPKTLDQWLSEALLLGGESVGDAIRMIDAQLRATNEFMGSKGLIHFDGHFDNVLTDGESLFFADFGLALSSYFELEESEIRFFRAHHSFDRCNSALCFVGFLAEAFFGREMWPDRLREYLDGTGGGLPREVDKVFRRDAEVAFAFRAFLLRLRESKSTPYPGEELERLLAVRDA